MAYCVHCGVKLGAGETKCPLCGIPVHDPLELQPAPAVKPYPIRTPEQDLRRGLAVLLSEGAHGGAAEHFIPVALTKRCIRHVRHALFVHPATL